MLNYDDGLINYEGKWLSPEVEVPLLTKGLDSLYGDNFVKNYFKVNSIRKIIKNPLLFIELKELHLNRILHECNERNNEESISVIKN